MESFTTKFIVAALLSLTCLACDLDLEFRCTGTDGNYVIVNPDSTTYTGVQAYHENGTECGTTVNGTQSGTFTVCECGLVSIIFSTYLNVLFLTTENGISRIS